ncbi:hypothetical protein RRG08_038130 [Elysia crispata]|uniref:Uncharacterized protein n=1 Tax=Elysia crispata TaxID=231223 RepID=A0AAE1DPA2_9GAST|nr:hypothetical protein RRG08_038130 [Elysia crispata]
MSFPTAWTVCSLLLGGGANEPCKKCAACGRKRKVISLSFQTSDGLLHLMRGKHIIAWFQVLENLQDTEKTARTLECTCPGNKDGHQRIVDVKPPEQINKDLQRAQHDVSLCLRLTVVI